MRQIFMLISLIADIAPIFPFSHSMRCSPQTCWEYRAIVAQNGMFNFKLQCGSCKLDFKACITPPIPRLAIFPAPEIAWVRQATNIAYHCNLGLARCTLLEPKTKLQSEICITSVTNVQYHSHVANMRNTVQCMYAGQT